MSNVRKACKAYTDSLCQGATASSDTTPIRCAVMSQADETVLGKRKRQDVGDPTQARIDHYFALRAPAKQTEKGQPLAQGKPVHSVHMQCHDASQLQSDLNARVMLQEPCSQKVKSSSEQEGTLSNGSPCTNGANPSVLKKGPSALPSCHLAEQGRTPAGVSTKSGKPSKLSGSRAPKAMQQEPDAQAAATAGDQQGLPDHLAVFLSHLAERQQFRE